MRPFWTIACTYFTLPQSNEVNLKSLLESKKPDKDVKAKQSNATFDSGDSERGSLFVCKSTNMNTDTQPIFQQPNPHRFSSYRKLLGKTGEKLSDEQIIALKNMAVVLSDLVIDDFLIKRQMNKQMETRYANTK